MVGGEQGGPVVVAVGERDDGQALDWAAAEAGARRCALQVVHATRLRWAVDPTGLVPVADFWSYRLAAEELVAEAVGRARSVTSDLEVSGHLVFGPPVAAVVSQGRGAQLLVLGSHPAAHPRRPRVPNGSSVCGRVAARAPCPVAVVPPLPCSDREGSPPRVVVGVTGSPSSAAALGFALRAAAQRGLGVTAVHARTASEASAHAFLDQALRPWRAEFADVPVAMRTGTGDPATALIAESRGAALVVIGSRGRGRSRWSRTVGREVIRGARCPVVVLHPAAAIGNQPAATGRRTAVRRTDAIGSERGRHRGSPWE